MHDVDLVRRAERLAQHVVDAGALENRTHRATGDHTGTGSSRTQQDDARGLLTLHRVRDRPLDAGNPEEVLLGFLDALGDGRRHLLGLAVADTDHAVAVAHDHEGGEAEAPPALHDLGHPVDGHDPLEVGRRRRAGPAPGAFPASVPPPGVSPWPAGASAPLSSWHYLLLTRRRTSGVLIRSRARLPALRRLVRRYAR